MQDDPLQDQAALHGKVADVGVEVVEYQPEWPEQFASVAAVIREALRDVASAAVEHVGSTSVPGLAAKPILDIDVMADPDDVEGAIVALEAIGYAHRGDLGVVGREAFFAPDDSPRRNVYVCQVGTLNARNHIAVRDVLRARPDLRDAYAAVKIELAASPMIDIDTYIAKKSAVLQRVLDESDLTTEEKQQIQALNDPSQAS